MHCDLVLITALKIVLIEIILFTVLSFRLTFRSFFFFFFFLGFYAGLPLLAFASAETPSSVWISSEQKRKDSSIACTGE